MSDDDMRIVPERDEIRARTSVKKPASSGAAASKSGQIKRTKAAVKPSTSGSGFMTIILCLFVVLLSGVSAYLYLQTQTLSAEKNELAARVLDIESKLSVTDESMSQSGAAMQAVLKEHSSELETHMSEIRKLWAVAYDRNRVSIEGLQKDQKNTGARLNSLSGSVAKLDPIIKGYDGIQSRIETISSQLLVQSATVDDLSSQARNLADGTNKISSQVNSQSSLIDQHQEAIDAIDQYRMQLNQRLLRLEQSLPQTQAPAATGG